MGETVGRADDERVEAVPLVEPGERRVRRLRVRRRWPDGAAVVARPELRDAGHDLGLVVGLVIDLQSGIGDLGRRKARARRRRVGDAVLGLVLGHRERHRDGALEQRRQGRGERLGHVALDDVPDEVVGDRDHAGALQQTDGTDQREPGGVLPGDQGGQLGQGLRPDRREVRGLTGH
jgi:hypothetical protein